LAARHIAKVSNGPKIVIEKSTLPVRTAHSMVRKCFPHLASISITANLTFCSNDIYTNQQQVLHANQKGLKFDILSNPEFLAEGKTNFPPVSFLRGRSAHRPDKSNRNRDPRSC